MNQNTPRRDPVTGYYRRITKKKAERYMQRFQGEIRQYHGNSYTKELVTAQGKVISYLY